MRRQNSVKIAPLRVGYELPVDVSTIHSNSPSFRITVGVKLAFLKALVKHEKYKHLTLLELCEVLSEEEEKEKGEEEESSLIDIFQRLYSSRPHKATGFLYSACFEENASHFVSYPKDCILLQLVANLEQHLLQDHPSFPSFNLPDFCYPLGTTLVEYLPSVKTATESSKVFLYILPDMLTSSSLFDTWSLYQLSILSRIESIDFYILFPPEQVEAFHQLLLTNFDALNETLFAIDFDTSVYSGAQEKEAIIQYLISSPPFYLFNITKSNTSILKLLRKWLVTYITHHMSIFSANLLLSSSERELSNVLKIGYLLYEYESYLAAKQTFLLLYSIYMGKYGPLHVNTLGIANSLVFTFEALHLPSQALTMARSVVEGYTSSSGPDHANTLAALNVCGALQRKLGLFSEGEKIYRTLLAQLEAQRGSDHPSVLQAMLYLAITLQGQKKVVESQLYHQLALEGCVLKLGVKHEITREVALSYGLLLREMKVDTRKSEELIEMAQEGTIICSKEQLGYKQPATSIAWNRRRTMLKMLTLRHASRLSANTLQSISSCSIS